MVFRNHKYIFTCMVVYVYIYKCVHTNLGNDTVIRLVFTFRIVQLLRQSCIHQYIYTHIFVYAYRRRIFVVVGFRPRIHTCVWFVPLSQSYRKFQYVQRMSGPGSISAGFQWTGLTAAAFQEAFCATYLRINRDNDTVGQLVRIFRIARPLRASRTHQYTYTQKYDYTKYLHIYVYICIPTYQHGQGYGGTIGANF